MDGIEITAQVFGIIGMICNIIVFQQKTHKKVLIWQFFAASVFAVNYFLLGAVVGGMLNLVGALRSVVFFFKEKTRANSIFWLIFFILAFGISYPLTFLAFGTEPTPKNFVVELLPVMAMIIATISLRLGSAKAVRRLGLISSPMWLAYNCFSGSIGAIASEILNLISIIVGIIRFDIKKRGGGKSLNGAWSYRVGTGKWSKRNVPFSALCVGHSECYRYFDLDKASDVVLLKFDGIAYEAEAYLNDAYLGKMLPYSEYTFDITKLCKKRKNHLLVKLEDTNASFGPSQGWENYGGIIRNVSLEYKKKGYIKDVYFTQNLKNNYQDAEYSVDACTSLPLDYRVTLSYDGKTIDSYISRGKEKRTISGIKTWSPELPNLYNLRVELLENGKVIDACSIKVGFCEFSATDSHFTLNGKDIFLKGVCKHEMYGESSGHTVSYKKIYKDMKMIKDAGCNFVRLVHYPHNKITLDIADELGLLVCEEPGMWQADVKDKALTTSCLEVLRRTVIRDRNHACIAFWLAFNECDFNEDFLKSAVKICRENDSARLVSGANNMPNEDTKKYYDLCDLDFYTMHPYSDTFEMARVASEKLTGKPLMFTEWGGYYVYDNPRLLTEFLMSMYKLYTKGALAGTCIWYWAEIKDYNRGAPACVDGTLKEALVDFNRKPNLIYDAFCKSLYAMENGTEPNICDAPKNVPCSIKHKYEVHKHYIPKGQALKSVSEPSIDNLLAIAKEPLETKLAKTRKKQIINGPVFENEKISGISSVPFVVKDTPLIFEGGFEASKLSFIGMTSLNYGYPILGEYGEDVLEISVQYENGEVQEYIAKNGIDITIAYASVGSSRINPIAKNARRAFSFSYDKNFEEYIVNCLEIKTINKAISKIEIKPLNPKYNVLIYGILK